MTVLSTAFTWTMVKPRGPDVRFVMVGGTLIRMERPLDKEWWVKSAYRAHPADAGRKAVKETEHLEAWGHVLKRHVSVMETSIDPLVLFEEAEKSTRIGPCLQHLLDFQDGVL